MKLKKVIILLRVSTKKQVREGEKDLPTQEAECMHVISQHPDWIYYEKIIELAVSAYNNTAIERDKLQIILDRAKNKEFDVLLAYTPDRIGRLADDSSIYVKALTQLGIEVWSVTDGYIRLDNEMDYMINYLTFWQAQMESSKTSQRVIAAQTQMVKQGRFVGGVVPYGYNLVQTNKVGLHNRLLHDVVIDEEKAEIVKEIFSLATVQMFGAYKISKTLNERGIPNKNGKEWQAGTVYDMLQNPFYKGIISYGRRYSKSKSKNITTSSETVKEYQIIDDATWEKAQLVRKTRKKENTSCISTNGFLVLSGLAFCGYCGKRLTNCSNNYKKFSCNLRYGCSGKKSGSTVEHEKYIYSQYILEETVFLKTCDYMNALNKQNIDKLIQDYKNETMSKLNKELSSCMDEKNKLLDDIKPLQDNVPAAMRGEYPLSVEVLYDTINHITNKINELTQSITELNKKIKLNLIDDDLNKIAELIPVWKEKYNESDVQDRKVLINTIIDRVIVKAEGVDIKYKYENLLTENPFTCSKWFTDFSGEVNTESELYKEFFEPENPKDIPVIVKSEKNTLIAIKSEIKPKVHKKKIKTLRIGNYYV